MKTSWIFLLYLAVSAPLLSAQTSDALNTIPPPHAPFVAPVPGSAQWTITLSYEGDDQDATAKNPAIKPKHRLHQITSIKTQNLKRDVEIYDDGTSETYWFVGGLILLPKVNGQEVRIIDFEQANRPVYGEAGNPVSSPGFTGVSWVQLKYYDKVVTMQNVPCYHYALDSKPPSPVPAADDTTNHIEAWINAKTGLPVAYRADGITYNYAFGNSPESDLDLPPDYAQALKAYQQIENRRKQLEKDLGK